LAARHFGCGQTAVVALDDLELPASDRIAVLFDEGGDRGIRRLAFFSEEAGKRRDEPDALRRLIGSDAAGHQGRAQARHERDACEQSVVQQDEAPVRCGSKTHDDVYKSIPRGRLARTQPCFAVIHWTTSPAFSPMPRCEPSPKS
jgi:hypothetical protein